MIESEIDNKILELLSFGRWSVARVKATEETFEGDDDDEDDKDEATTSSFFCLMLIG